MFIPMTAVTNYHELGGLTHMDHLLVLEARSPRWVLGGVTRPCCCLEVLKENPFLAFFGFQRLPAFPGTFLGSSQGLPPSLKPAMASHVFITWNHSDAHPLASLPQFKEPGDY